MIRSVCSIFSTFQYSLLFSRAGFLVGHRVVGGGGVVEWWSWCARPGTPDPSTRINNYALAVWLVLECVGVCSLLTPHSSCWMMWRSKWRSKCCVDPYWTFCTELDSFRCAFVVWGCLGRDADCLLQLSPSRSPRQYILQYILSYLMRLSAVCLPAHSQKIWSSFHQLVHSIN